MNPRWLWFSQLIFVMLIGGIAILAGINTSQQRQLVRLEIAQSNYENMITSMPSTGLIVVNEKGMIVRWSRGAESIFGWSFEEAVGKKVSDLLIPEKYADMHRQKLLLAMKRVDSEDHSTIQHVRCVAKTKSGKETEIFLTTSVGRGRYGKIWGFGIVHPIHDVRVLELKEP